MYEALIKKYIKSKSLYKNYFLEYSFYNKEPCLVVCIFTKKKIIGNK
jgi:hypothetical protein